MRNLVFNILDFSKLLNKLESLYISLDSLIISKYIMLFLLIILNLHF